MIPAATDTWKLQKDFRDVLIEQSGLSADNVINSLSIMGADFEKLISGKVYNSYEMTDSAIFFELRSSDKTNFSAPSEDGSINSYHSFRFHLYIYGNKSHELAMTIRARLLYNRPQVELIEKGIHVIDVAAPILINEYINGRMWPRTDLDIDVDCRFNLSPLKESEEIKTADFDIKAEG